MKIRIHAQSIRIRLSPAEVEQLRNKGGLVQETRIGPGVCLKMSLEIAGDDPEVRAEEGWKSLVVRIPASRAGEWLEGNAGGVKVDLAAGESPLTVTVETDLRP